MQTLGTVSGKGVPARVFLTAQCGKETYSGSSNTLDERLNLQQAGQKSTETVIYEDQQIKKKKLNETCHCIMFNFYYTEYFISIANSIQAIPHF